MEEDRLAWEVLRVGEYLHVVPANATEEHLLTDKCKCHPDEEEDDDTIFIHNSFDGREAFETGERKTS